MVVSPVENDAKILLGTITRNVSTFRDKRLAKWALQAEARHILPREKVSMCMRLQLTETVDVLYAEKFATAHYGGLAVCGSIWVCPVCAQKITERRRVELDKAVKACNERGGSVFMQTYTFSHKRFDSLPESLEAFMNARRKSKQGRAAMDLKKQYVIIGTITCLEVTWSELNGWHPHQHELIFFGESDFDQATYEKAARAIWERSVLKAGLRVNKHGYKFDRTYGAVADYIAKFGHEPNGPTWGVDAEMTKGHLKQAASKAMHYTPFALLYESMKGHGWASSLFQEYASAFKGHHQLHWSKNLKVQLLDEEEKTDLELAEEQEENASLLGKLTREQWQIVLGNDARGELLEVALSANWDKVLHFLVELGCEVAAIWQYGMVEPLLWEGDEHA